MPYKKGTEIFLVDTPDNFKLGFYRVKVSSDDINATKLFAFSKNSIFF